MEFTHTGEVTSRGLAFGIWKIRETTKFWVSQSGLKFRKTNGTQTGPWLIKIDLTTVRATP